MAAASVEENAPHHRHTGDSPSRKEKKRLAKALEKEILTHPVIGLVGFRGVPASNLQSMRRDLAERKHSFHVVPNSRIRHALEAAGKERPHLKQLEKHVSDQTAVVLTDANPFLLYKELEKTRSKVPPKGGEIAPEDVWVYAGETSFKPGPIVGEMQHAGFPAAIEKGKVVLKKDTLIVKKGAVIHREVAQMLARLEVKPLTVGLMLRVAMDGETLYASDVLAVDFDAMLQNMVLAQAQALGLATHVAFPTPQTIPRLLAKAKRQALALALERGFISPDTITPLLSKAARQGSAIKGLTN